MKCAYYVTLENKEDRRKIGREECTNRKREKMRNEEGERGYKKECRIIKVNVKVN